LGQTQGIALFLPSVFDSLQYASMEGKGLGGSAMYCDVTQNVDMQGACLTVITCSDLQPLGRYCKKRLWDTSPATAPHLSTTCPSDYTNATQSLPGLPPLYMCLHSARLEVAKAWRTRLPEAYLWELLDS